MYAKSTRLSAKREVQKERSATIESRALGALKPAREAPDENVPAKRADFFFYFRPNQKVFFRYSENIFLFYE